MVSPFPGMDPYLEDPGIWRDVHVTLIVALRAEINRRLPSDFTALADRHVWIEDPDDDELQARFPDVAVARRKTKGGKASGATAVLAAPRTITLPMADSKGKPYLKIKDRQSRRVVTVLELLSPTNKSPGVDRERYLAKRQEYLDSKVSVVEIDLLRAGRLPPLSGSAWKDMQYYYLVCRSWDLPRAEIWPFTVRQPLPDLPIPLRPQLEIAVPMRPCFDRTYDEGRYENDVNYARPPIEPLGSEDAAWAKALLKEVR